MRKIKNPFTQSVPLKAVQLHNMVRTITKVGKEQSEKSTPVPYTVPTSKKVSVYVDHGIMQRMFNEATPAGFKLYFYILHNIPKSYYTTKYGKRKKRASDQITLNPTEVMEAIGVTKKTLYKGINDLIRIGIINRMEGRGSESKYWLNPHLIYGEGKREDDMREADGQDAVNIIKPEKRQSEY